MNDKAKKTTVKGKAKKKRRVLPIVLIVIVLLVGAFVTVFALNLFGFRDDVLAPLLRDVPVIGNLFPEEEDDEEAEAEQMTYAELRNLYNSQALQIESLQNQIAALHAEIDASRVRIADLIRFEERWNEYRYARALMDQAIAHGDPINFVDFFDHVSEENLPQLYAEAALLADFERRTDQLVRVLNSMEESAAGEILENLLTQELALMMRVIERMSPGRIAMILETIDADVRTRIFIMTSVDMPTFAPLLPPYLPEMPPLLAVPPAEMFFPPVDDDDGFEDENDLDEFDEDEFEIEEDDFEDEEVNETEEDETETDDE